MNSQATNAGKGREWRLRPLGWLLSSAAAQFVAYWYPWEVARANPSPDGDGRYFVSPTIVFGAAAVGAVSVLILLRRIGGYSRTSRPGVLLVACMAAIVALLPACLLLWKMFRW